jgi:hypothetical protein
MQLFLPSVDYFTNVLGDCGAWVAPASKPSMRVVAVVKLALGVQVVLGRRLVVALQMVLGTGSPVLRSK